MVDTLVKKQKIQDVNLVYTIKQYFELEEKAAFKSEFINGKIIRMTGGTFNHMALSGMLYFLLLGRFINSDKETTVVTSDFKIHIPNHNKMLYADGSVAIGEMEMYEKGNQAYENPTLIIEVLSKSTEKYDRSGKFRMYQTLPSFKEYLLINQDAPVVEVFLKIENNKWQMTSYVGLDKIVELDTLDIELKMSDIYKTAKNLKDPQFAIDFPEDERE